QIGKLAVPYQLRNQFPYDLRSACHAPLRKATAPRALNGDLSVGVELLLAAKLRQLGIDSEQVG
ncbi:MAG: hypothetical protein ACOYMP_14825, partial [Nodosilinea sp.]